MNIYDYDSNSLLYSDCGKITSNYWKGFSISNSLLVNLNANPFLVSNGFTLHWECATSKSTSITYYLNNNHNNPVTNNCLSVSTPCDSMTKLLQKSQAAMNYENLNLVVILLPSAAPYTSLCGQDYSFLISIVIQGQDGSTITIDCGGAPFITADSQGVVKLRNLNFIDSTKNNVPLFFLSRLSLFELKSVRFLNVYRPLLDAKGN